MKLQIKQNRSMPNPNPVQSEDFKSAQFKPIAAQPLCRKARSVKLPQDVDAAIESLPKKQRSEWLRRVIVAAARAELMRQNNAGKML